MITQTCKFFRIIYQSYFLSIAFLKSNIILSSIKQYIIATIYNQYSKSFSVFKLAHTLIKNSVFMITFYYFQLEQQMISIYNYLNFREYLRDVFIEHKKASRCFSHRYLSRKLGLSTSNHILLIIQGKRNLTTNVRVKLSTFLGLSKTEDEYFEYMVSFLHAKSLHEKTLHFDKMMGFRNQYNLTRLSDVQFHQVKANNLVDHNFAGVTVMLSDRQFKEAVKEISDLRKKVINKTPAAGEAARVFQPNLQLFPVSKTTR